jgi:hypothetical protein
MQPLTVLAAASSSASAIRQALIPMTAGYVILMAALAIGLRRLYRRAATAPDQPQARPPGSPRRLHWAALARLVIGTAIGGYLLLMAVVVGYYFGVAKVGSNFLESAATGTALLMGVSAPVYAAASWLTERPRRHDSRETRSQPRRG